MPACVVSVMLRASSIRGLLVSARVNPWHCGWDKRELCQGLMCFFPHVRDVKRGGCFVLDAEQMSKLVQ